jgi:multidrug efflux system outer membrane protein
MTLAVWLAVAGPASARQQLPPSPPAPATQTPAAPIPQTPPAVPESPPVVVPERVTFEDAVRRAIERNPSVAVASADILRAEGLLRQARAVTLPNIDITGTNTTLDDSRGLAGQTFTPQNTFNTAASFSMPLFAPAMWARRVQAEDTRRVAEAGVDEARRQIAVATAQAYLSVIAAHRVVESQVRARDTAQAFYDYASQRLQAGAGSRLNALQAQQTLSVDQVLVETSQLALFRAQEALGVLVTSDRPLDATDEPAFEVPEESRTLAGVDQEIQQRRDLKFSNLQIFADRRIVSDSWKDWLPTATGAFQPIFQQPGSLITPQTSWRAVLQFEIPVFDAGQRRGLKMVREANLRQSEASYGGLLRQAKSEVRLAYEAVRRSSRALDGARAASQQSEEVLNITNFSFRTGATTYIEVIDAQRRARDADTAVAVAEDAVRQARLDLLTALGRFPR